MSLFFFFCSGFCHTLKWISHGFTCAPHPNPPSHLPLRLIPLGLPSAPWLAILLCTGKYHFAFLFSSQASYIQSSSSRNCGPFTNPICPLTSFLGGDGGGLFAKSCPTLAIPWTVAFQAPLSRRFSRQEYWSGLPFPSPGDLPNPDIKPRLPALQADDLPTELWGKPNHFLSYSLIPRSPNPGQTSPPPGSLCSIFLSRAELSLWSPIKD